MYSYAATSTECLRGSVKATYLLQRRDEFPVIGRSRMDDRGRDVHDGGSNAGALGLEADNLDLGETPICWGLRHRGQGKEVLGRVIEACKIAQRCDASSSVLVEEARRNRFRAVDDEFQVSWVEIPFVNIGNSVEIALLEANAMICRASLEV